MIPCCCNTHNIEFNTFTELYPKLVTLGHYNYLSIDMQINDVFIVRLSRLKFSILKTYRTRQQINKQANLQLFSSGKSVFQLNGIRSLHSFLLSASV